MAALNMLGGPNPSTTLNEVMLKHVVMEALSPDAKEFVRKATGM